MNKRNQMLEETLEGFELLGNPQNNLKFIYVTGTVGKGSTCIMISKILEKAGYKVGTITSPSLVNPMEGIKINSKPISERKFNLYATRAMNKGCSLIS